MTSYMTFGGLRFEGAIDHDTVLPADHTTFVWEMDAPRTFSFTDPGAQILPAPVTV